MHACNHELRVFLKLHGYPSRSNGGSRARKRHTRHALRSRISSTSSSSSSSPLSFPDHLLGNMSSLESGHNKHSTAPPDPWSTLRPCRSGRPAIYYARPSPAKGRTLQKKKRKDEQKNQPIISIPFFVDQTRRDNPPNGWGGLHFFAHR